MYGVAFDRQSIEQMLQDFYNLTNIRITFLSYNFEEAITVKKEMSGFCERLRTDENANSCCLNCDDEAFETACKTKKLFLYECHAGLTEAVSPIFIDDVLLGYLMFGQTLRSVPNNELWKKVQQKCSNYNINFVELQKEFYKLNYLDWCKIEAAARIMDRNAKYIHFSKMATLRHPNLLQQITDYVDTNLDKPLSISTISTHFNMSKSYLSSKIKAHFNSSLNEYIMKKRIERAKTLLETTDFKILKISEIVGYADPNYFSRVFKKVQGISPEEYKTNFNNK